MIRFTKNIVALCLLALTSLSILSCGNNNTTALETTEPPAQNLNVEYQNIGKIECYENYDPSINTSSWSPLANDTDCFDGRYSIEIKDNLQTMSFYYSGHKYRGRQLEPSNYSVTGEYKVDKFYNIRDLILEDEIQNYEYTFDEDGKVVSSPEKYYFIIVYSDPVSGKAIHMAIKTPSHVDEIIKLLDEMIVANAEQEKFLHIDDE